jgi:photosystem II stability/assembly factor-like uncharacterized protein
MKNDGKLDRPEVNWKRVVGIAVFGLVSVSIWMTTPLRVPCPALSEIYALDGQAAWVAGCSGVYSTRDAGRSWVRSDLRGEIFYDVARMFSPILWADGGHALVRATTGLEVVATDGRVAQESRYPDALPGLGFGEPMKFADRQDGWSCYGAALRTTDGGVTWNRVSEEPCVVVIPINADEAWFKLASGAFAHTRDGGRSWLDDPSPVKGCTNPSMERRNSGEIWLSCSDPTANYHSLDHGQSWHAVPSPEPVRPLAFSSLSEGWGTTDLTQPTVAMVIIYLPNQATSDRLVRP